uniref:Septin-type G domain-containing protein n=1 Tax=Castor canadensis TaxID=51338 RepID=A0A8C0WKJ4_CASCN
LCFLFCFYPWGVAEFENGEHCDFTVLRNMWSEHMQDLKDVTNNVHYENYRSRKLAAVTYNGVDNNKNKGELTTALWHKWKKKEGTLSTFLHFFLLLNRYLQFNAREHFTVVQSCFGGLFTGYSKIKGLWKVFIEDKLP